MARTSKSFFTPVLLIVAGVLLLVWNVVPEFSFGRIFASSWPWLLVAWGAFRIAEVAVAQLRGTPLPQRLGFAHFLLAVMLCSAGALTHAIYDGSWIDVEWHEDPQTFDFDLDLSHAVDGETVVELAGLRGDIEILGTDGQEVRVRGRKRVRATERDIGERRHAESPLELTGDGSVVRLKYGARRQPYPRLDVTVELPRSVALAVEGLSGRLEARDVDGDITISGARASLKFAELGGSVRAELERAERVEANTVAGAFALDGSTEKVSLVEIGGPVRVRGNVFGEIVLADIRGAVDVASKNSELSCVALEGMAELTGSRFELRGVTGPAVLRSKGSKRMMVSEFAGPMEITGQRADVELDASAPLTGDVRVHVERGDVDLELPREGFQLTGKTGRGRVVDDYGEGLERRREDQGAVVSLGSEGPVVTIQVDRGDLRVVRGDGGDSAGDEGALEEVEL